MTLPEAFTHMARLGIAGKTIDCDRLARKILRQAKREHDHALVAILAPIVEASPHKPSILREQTTEPQPS